jgi:drug/metabolite transporter (DMT)-like permease
MAAPPPLTRSELLTRNAAVGCLTAVVGFFSGGMIAVLIGKFVGSAQGCQPPEGLPACNWWVYAGVGAVIGAMSLPFLALRRLSRPVEPDQSKR